MAAENSFNPHTGRPIQEDLRFNKGDVSARTTTGARRVL